MSASKMVKSASALAPQGGLKSRVGTASSCASKNRGASRSWAAEFCVVAVLGVTSYAQTSSVPLAAASGLVGGAVAAILGAVPGRLAQAMPSDGMSDSVLLWQTASFVMFLSIGLGLPAFQGAMAPLSLLPYGAAALAAWNVLLAWRFTEPALAVVEDRIQNFWKNWNESTVRCFVEIAGLAAGTSVGISSALGFANGSLDSLARGGIGAIAGFSLASAALILIQLALDKLDEAAMESYHSNAERLARRADRECTRHALPIPAVAVEASAASSSIPKSPSDSDLSEEGEEKKEEDEEDEDVPEDGSCVSDADSDAGKAAKLVGEAGERAPVGVPCPLDLPSEKDMIWREEQGVSVLVPRGIPARKHRAVEAPVRRDITMAEVARHCSRSDAWICIEGRAYDVTSYVERHPGGWLPIADLAGKDVTDAFANYHPAAVYEQLLPQFYIGDVKDYHESSFVRQHRAIRQDLLREGLFETRPSFYAYMGAWYVLLFGSAIFFTVFRPTVWEHMVGAFFMAFFWQQVAFFGHDIGHNAVSHKRESDLWWGIVLGNTTGGISLAWWKRSHNVHHIVCNSIEHDPDIQHMPIFAVDEGIFGKFFSTYHQREVVTDAVARFLVQYQHWLYFPVMAVARFNLYAQGWLLLLSKEKVQFKRLELATLAVFVAWFSAMVWLCLGSWQERLGYLLLSHGIAGLLHVQITLSHFAEDTYHGAAYNDESDEWFRMQVKTSLNVDCPEWLDWFHGGLQFQVEHHLYPRLPRHNLRAARRRVRALCAQHGVEYKEMGFVECVSRVVDKMRATAAKAGKLEKGDAGFYQSPLYAGLHAEG